jgi:hypothetical protein
MTSNSFWHLVQKNSYIGIVTSCGGFISTLPQDYSHIHLGGQASGLFPMMLCALDNRCTPCDMGGAIGSLRKREKEVAMQQGIAKGDVLSRIAGIAFIVGGVLLIVGNILHPRVSDPSNMQALIQSIAGNTGGLWELDHLLLAAGIWGLMIGVVGV